jgi:hypothetical protein
VHHNYYFYARRARLMRILLDKQTAIGLKGALRVGPDLRAKVLAWQVARCQGYNLAEILL